MGEPLKAGQTVLCVFKVAVIETHALNCEMADGNGVNSNVTGKVDEVLHDGKGRKA